MIAAPLAAPAKTARALPVRGPGDVVAASHHAQRLARELGLSRRRAAAVAIVVSELASNIVKYGVRGEVAIEVRPLADRTGAAGRAPFELAVVATDIGPPIRNLALALADHCSDHGPIDPALLLRRGGLGTGLGAVVRLSDRFECQQEETGKTITAGFACPPPG
jgi:anti-sigma regulatory factor (Ser/Thr protein kinase)